ncbi:hypothetical protein CEXT_119431 [Caerostris extrusa]|uniref:Uncharacterized protein n=1 Tax=Caerostris extrusa TaxID=172846 RepID=A0AAV4N523_CAEEX|nr:hypothetical protein CEXT_119431 [Caerostris extrusa]
MRTEEEPKFSDVNHLDRQRHQEDTEERRPRLLPRGVRLPNDGVPQNLLEVPHRSGHRRRVPEVIESPAITYCNLNG